MKSTKTAVHGRFHKIPTLRFENKSLTSFAGAAILQVLFRAIGLRDRLKRCFARIGDQSVFGRHTLFLLLVMHILLGFRRLRGLDYYRSDPYLRHTMGVRCKLPDVSTLTRAIGEGDVESVEQVRQEMRSMVVERLRLEGVKRITVDFDGTVNTTKARRIEGTAVGFNKTKKGQRSYYPLMATVAQTGQVLDILHRPGNVHDSKHSIEFSMSQISTLKKELGSSVRIESRLDSAFFNEHMVETLNSDGVEFTISVPFERFGQLKAKIESRKRWKKIDGTWSYFECKDWKPKEWTACQWRFIFIRQKRQQQFKGPVQQDFFEPRDTTFDYKVIVTNKKESAKAVLLFHNGRGSQEGIFAELKSCAHFDYLPFRSRVGNRTFMLASSIAHNLGRELQMRTNRPVRQTTPKRAPMWDFRNLSTLRNELFLRAGRITRPANDMTLTICADDKVAGEIVNIIDNLQQAA